MDSLNFNTHRLLLVQRVLRSDWNGTSTNSSAMAPPFSMSNQKPTGSPWNSPAGKTLNFGASSSTPVEEHANTAPGAAYNLAGAGATATVALTLTPAPQEGPTTPTYIVQPGPPYEPTHAGAPTMAAHIPTAPVAPVPVPPVATYAPSPFGATYAPSPLEATYAPSPLGAIYVPSPLGAAYAPSSGASAHTVHPTNAPYRCGNPTAAPGHTYQRPPPQFSPILTGGHFPPSTQPPMAPSPARLPTPSWHSSPTPYSPPPPPPRATTPGRGRDMIDLSDVSLPPPRRSVYQSLPSHPSIMDETGLSSKETQRIIDRFVTDIGGRDLSRRFKGVVNSETVTSLDMTNDPVIFAEQFRAGFAGLPSWALSADTNQNVETNPPCL